jgi:hypothetical protein
MQAVFPRAHIKGVDPNRLRAFTSRPCLMRSRSATESPRLSVWKKASKSLSIIRQQALRVLDSTGLATVSSYPRASALLACPDSCASNVSRNDERREDREDDEGDRRDCHDQSLALEDCLHRVRSVVRYTAALDDLRWGRDHRRIVARGRYWGQVHGRHHQPEPVPRKQGRAAGREPALHLYREGAPISEQPSILE